MSLFNYLICILSFIYFSLGRYRCFLPWLRLMSDSEVIRLKMGAFTFHFETLPPSSCLSPHSSCQSSLFTWWMKSDLWCRGLRGTVWGFIPHTPAPAIYSLFLHISAERPTNKSVVCTKLYLFYSSCIYWLINVNHILLPTRNKVSQREKLSYIKIVIPIIICFVRIQFVYANIQPTTQ